MLSGKSNTAHPLNGMHTAGLFADATLDGPEIGTLIAVVDRGKNLPNRKTIGKQDPYCHVRLGKESKKTATDVRGGQTPKWDQELRFTVHESPDYLQLKVSVFTDDKKTDLIGEAWIDLRDIIVSGGGQSDKWHGLTCRGKYAGEIRMEITFYDTRPKPEKAVVKPALVASTTPDIVARQVPKRRPLPTDPVIGEESPSASDSPLSKALCYPSASMPSELVRAESIDAPITPECSVYPYSDTTSRLHESNVRHSFHQDFSDPGYLYAADIGHDNNVANIQYTNSFPSGIENISNRPIERPEQYQVAPQPSYSSSLPASQFSIPRPALNTFIPSDYDDQPPPPPVHKSRHLGSFDKSTRPEYCTSVDYMSPSTSSRHDIPRGESRWPSAPASSAYPGRPQYKPSDSAPVGSSLTYAAHHTSNDSGYEFNHMTSIVPRQSYDRTSLYQESSAPPSTVRRKSVSPVPYNSQPRRNSLIPFGPESYNELNPVVPQSSVLDLGGVGNHSMIITHDGKHVDPSDHLPMSSWAPEPEKTSSKDTKPPPQPQSPNFDAIQRTAQNRLTGHTSTNDYISNLSQSSIVRRSADSNQNLALYSVNSSAGSAVRGDTSFLPNQRQDDTLRGQQFRGSHFPPSQYLSNYSPSRNFGFNEQPHNQLYGYQSSSVSNFEPTPTTREADDEWALLQEIQSIDIGSGRSRRRRAM